VHAKSDAIIDAAGKWLARAGLEPIAPHAPSPSAAEGVDE
jgi:hypothetical protein